MKNSLLLFAAAVISTSTLGQTQADKKISTKKTQQEKSVKIPEAVEWSPSDDVFMADSKIPPRFNGASPKAIIGWIDARYPAVKGEFEKQSEYDAKRTAVENQIFKKSYAFRVGHAFSSKLKYQKYDADSESYVPYKFDSIYDVLEEDIETRHSNLGTYSASNAYGRSVQVSKFYMENHGISIRSSHLLRSGMFSQESPQMFSTKSIPGIYLAENLKVPIDTAKTIDKDNINFLFVSELESVVIKKSSVCLTPKIDSPSDGCSISRYISVRPKKIIVYEYESGQILYEKNLEDPQ